MNVRLATQLFSRSVAVGLKFYREQQKPGFEGTEGTESFTRRMNDLFDALNAKCPAEGIRKNSPQLKVIIDFLDMLNSTEKESVKNNTKLFASQMTTESLRVTLMYLEQRQGSSLPVKATRKRDKHLYVDTDFAYYHKYHKEQRERA
ncbi:hypothetical protein V5799_033164 [Amblyomma americanum]|uniref:Transposable element P transposase-like GTP-binding insertion domain-containing protein n=1 Tax=Amblyomma americanum TaxID=6943 RepID=A0AAQ4DP37_AMBAM